MTWLALFVMIMALWCVLPYVAKGRRVTRLAHQCKMERAISLTYDDGPGTRVTRGVLDTLRNFGASATFFMLGCKIDALTESAIRVINEGHEIGSHSYRHLHAWKRDPISIFMDIRDGIRSTRSLGRCYLFRAPYGKLTLASLVQVWAQDCRQSWWTIDSSDTWSRPKPVAAILEDIRQRGGGVILLHDHDRPNDPEREAYVLELTRAILEMARDEGYRMCRLSDILCT